MPQCLLGKRRRHVEPEFRETLAHTKDIVGQILEFEVKNTKQQEMIRDIYLTCGQTLKNKENSQKVAPMFKIEKVIKKPD
jgi:hypothetical protein